MIFDPGPQLIGDYISDINRLIISLNQSDLISLPLVLMPRGAAEMLSTLNQIVQGLNNAGISTPYFKGPQDVSAFISLINTLNILASTGPASYLGLVASRARMTSGAFGQQSAMSRSAHFATENLSAVKIAFGNWLGGNPDTSNGVAISITASVEYPAGTFTQIKFGGNPTGSIPDKATIFSDFATVSGGIPKGSLFWIRIFTNGPGGIYLNNWWNTFLGEGINFGTGIADQTMGGTVTGGTNFSMPPLMILGMTKNPSVIIFGDSIAAGLHDTEDSSSSNTGFNAVVGVIARGLPSTVPFVNLSIAGTLASAFSTAAIARKNALGYSSHLASQMGVNDISNSESSATLIAALQVIWNAAKAVNPAAKVFQTTLTPLSSSTDNWATAGNQTPESNHAVKATFNNAVRAGLSGAVGFYDVASVYETAQNSDIWITNGTANFYTVDGTHPSTAGYALIPGSGVIKAPTYP